MKEYTVIREFWRKGILQPVGAVISMHESEAKYLGHALEAGAKKAEAEQEAVKVEVEEVKEAPAVSHRKRKHQGAVVTEAPADGDSTH